MAGRDIRRIGGTFVLVLLALVVVRSDTAAGGEAKPAAAAAPADAGRPAEFKVLDRWIGTWDLHVTIKPCAWAKDGLNSTFVSTATWDLHGRFLRCDAKGKASAGGGPPSDDSFLWMCTWEPQRMAYRTWVFWASAGGGENAGGHWGGAPAATATWDEATKTMTTRSEDKEAGITSVGVTRWIDADHHEFVNTFKDAAGQVMMEQVGKATRKK